MSQNTYIFQLFSLPTEMYKKVTHVFGSICLCVCNRRAERTNSCPVSRKQCSKLYWESIVFSICMKTSAEAIFRRGKLNLGWSLYGFFWSLGSPFRGLTVSGENHRTMILDEVCYSVIHFFRVILSHMADPSCSQSSLDKTSSTIGGEGM